MSAKNDVFTYLQGVCTVLALLLNSLLIYVARKNSISGIGAYKYLLIAFAVFEMLYALIVLIGMPIHIIAEKSWTVFSHDGIIGHTPFNWVGPALYCTFYELWMGLVVVQFIYRYVVVCRIEWRQKIEGSLQYRILLALIYTVHFIYSFVCGFYICTKSEMPDKLLTRIHDDFDVDDPKSIGFIMIRFKTLEGELSPFGTIGIVNHYVLVLFSGVIILFCGVNVWRTIHRMAKGTSNASTVSIQRQMFFTLLIQTTIPVFFSHLPTLIYLIGTAPFVSDDFTFGASSSILSVLTTVCKILDPLVAMVCIRQYRHAVANMFCCRKGPRAVGTIPSSSDRAHTI